MIRISKYEILPTDFPTVLPKHVPNKRSIMTPKYTKHPSMPKPLWKRVS